MGTLTVELKIDRRLDVDVHIEDVVGAINNCEMKRRWSHIANIIKYVQLDLSDLTDDQKITVKNFLTEKLSIFQK